MIRTMLNTKPSADTEHIAELTQETVDEQGSVLIFCSSRKACQLLAEQLRKMVLCAYSNRLGESREQLLRDVEAPSARKAKFFRSCETVSRITTQVSPEKRVKPWRERTKGASFAFCAAQARWRQV